MIWRYDPILTNEEYNVSFHQEAFARIAHELKDHTSKCMLGFMDHYPHIRNSIQPFNINPLTKEEIEEMAVSFKKDNRYLSRYTAGHLYRQGRFKTFGYSQRLVH